MQLADTHAHLNLGEFDEDLDEVIERALHSGVSKILCVGTTLRSSERAVEIARRFPGVVYGAVGIHPNHAAESGPEELTEIEALARLPEVVAIGETGLDFHYDYTPPNVQHEFFHRHIALSRMLSKPLVIHSRDSEQQVLGCLGAYSPPIAGIRHCFSSSAQLARRYVELGLHISFAANVARAGHRKLKAAAAAVPADRLLVETDCPYMVPPAVRTSRNEPALVTHTLKALSEIRGVEMTWLAGQTMLNAERLLSFG